MTTVMIKRGATRLACIALVLGISQTAVHAIADPAGGALTGQRYRVIVSTDIGGSDFDDDQSMVHLLQYADVLDIEGLISSPPGAGRKADIDQVINAYESDYSNLSSYSNDYPAPIDLRNMTKQGAINGSPSQGWSADGTDGSDHIIARAQASDSRPLYILVWGSITDVAQAVHDAPSIKSKIRVVCIAGSSGFNFSGDQHAWNYLYNSHSDLWLINMISTFRGMFEDSWNNTQYGNGPFITQHCANHGALGNYINNLSYGSSGEYIKAGDTPSVLYLLRGDPASPTTNHWGGRFAANSHGPNYWVDITDPAWAIVKSSEITYYGAKTVSQYHDNFMADWAARMNRSQTANPDGPPPGGDEDLHEAEDLSFTTSGPGTTLVAESGGSGGEWIKFDAVGTGQWIQFTVPNVAVGNYSVSVLDKTHYTRGTYQLSIDGANVGVPVAQYGSSATYREIIVGDVSITSAGNKTFRFTVSGKHAGSSGYNLSIDAIVLTPEAPAGGAYEVEDVTRTTSGPATTLVVDANASGGEMIKLESTAAGQWVEFTLPNVPAGTYTVKVKDKTHYTRGIYQLSVAGTNVGSPVDQYGSTAIYGEVTVGNVSISTSGNKAFRFTVTGKSSGSSGYSLLMDAITLTPL